MNLYSLSQDIPIYPGCEKPLLGDEGINAAHYHGLDGFGDVPLGQIEEVNYQQNTLEKTHAAQAIINLTRKYPGTYNMSSRVKPSQMNMIYKIRTVP